VLVSLCRFYQSFFPVQSVEASHLHDLFQKSDKTEFMETYFKHEVEKGAEFIKRFEAFQPAPDAWKRGKVLDFGCGIGGISCHLGSRFAEAWGYDIQPEKIVYGNKALAERGIKNVTVGAYDGSRLPKEDGFFDFIFSVDVLEHVSDVRNAFKEFYRVLKPGGRIYLSFGPPWRHAHGKHMWETLPGWWTHLLFPRPVVMKVRGFNPATTYESIGLNKLTVSGYEKLVKGSGFKTLFHEYHINRAVAPMVGIPVLREFFISEIVAVLEKPR
jgi:ubiquinone/menaquinone biosynthesis C-methylase UbiE